MPDKERGKGDSGKTAASDSTSRFAGFSRIALILTVQGWIGIISACDKRCESWRHVTTERCPR